ncbi:MAG: hypothetical protein NMNS01_27770 [Nitrosomonas sp.]|nr:MAG: hypothetical protein NMNS01_27770 [Nitrosomonas sp.]
MLFITNREPKGSIKKSKKDQHYDFDLKKNSLSNSVFFCKRNAMCDYTEIGSVKLMKLIRKSKVKQILLYIHVCSNLPEPHIFPRTQKLQSLFDEKENNLVTVLPLI